MDKTRRFTRCVALLAAWMILAGTAVQAADLQTPANEKDLIAILKSAAPGGDKAIACKQLTVFGSAEAVPALAPLLADPQLASWARIALEAIPGQAADDALRSALPSLKGDLLIGVINSLGVRRAASAVEPLTARLKDADPAVAAAAAVALGQIGNDASTKALRQLLAGAPAGAVRSAVAQGCILCAERLLADGKASQAAEVYDDCRADLPKQRIIEATRGAIIARKTDGIPLLVEQLRSQDKGLFLVGLQTARELPGREVAEALAGELSRSTPQRAILLLSVLGDTKSPVMPAAVVEAMKTGPKEVRIAAIGAVGELGDVSSLSTLLELAASDDAQLAQAARAALGSLSGDKVNAEIIARLPKAQGKTFAVLVELVGQRRIEATPALVKALDQNDAAIRAAVLTALGETIGLKDLSVLIGQVVDPKNPSDAAVAQKALRAACVRMPQTEECAAQVATAMPKASGPTKVVLLEILGAMGGTKALDTVVAAVRGNEADLQESGSNLLGKWMTIDAAPALLDLAKTAPGDKYRVRALRGYIRIARQFVMPDAQRAEMCQKALDAATRPDEQKLVLEILKRYANPDSFKVAAKAIQIPGLKEEATEVAMAIVQKTGGSAADQQALLSSIGLSPMKVEIIKAEYGAGATQKDVTAVLQKFAGSLPLIALPSDNYNTSFGGDPAPNVVKQLKVQYRINAKEGEAQFAENAVILLPVPK